MKTSDFVLRSLWYCPELQRFLASLGFYEVEQSLLFNKTEGNQILLKSTLVVVSTMLGKLGATSEYTATHALLKSTATDGGPRSAVVYMY